MAEEKSKQGTYEDTLESLNHIQRQSVLSDANYLQILAGPGSGKTRVLTLRVAYFVNEKKINPYQIIVVTFTNKAANEMIERLNVLIGPKRTKLLLIGTFHSICSRLLRRHGNSIGVTSNFNIADHKMSEEIIEKIKTDKTLDLDKYWNQKVTKGSITQQISNAKSKGITSSKYAEMANNTSDNFKKYISIVFTHYQEELRKANLLDFDDLLLTACKLLRVNKSVLSNIKAVLVDEYQDTNIVQYDLIKLITQQENEKVVTIVGDPDQSIFSWRSAEPENFNKMKEDFDTTSINMERNYRSTGSVLKSALHVITQDRKRIGRSLYTNNPEGIPISLITTNNEDDQAEFIAKEIKRVIKYSKGLIVHKDIAVLMRMNFISGKLERVFRRNKIPFTIVGGDRFFDRVEIKDILSYLRFVYNPTDSYSFKRIINVPKRGIGEVNLNKIIKYKEGGNMDMLSAIEKISCNHTLSGITEAVRKKLKEFYNICMEIQRQISMQEEVSDILTFIIEAINYENYLNEHYHQECESRWNNVSELISLAKQYSSESGDDEEDDDSSAFFVSQDYTKNESFSSSQKKDEGVTVLSEDQYQVEDEDDEFSDFNIYEMPDDVSVIDVANEDEKTESQGSSQKYNQSQSGSQKNSSSQRNSSSQSNEFASSPKKDPIAAFLEYSSLCSNQKELDEAEGGKVTIATMHSSKGLEWPCVFIPTCCSGIIPASMSDNINEEGRLLYVAMTRSKFLLYCISPQERYRFGQKYEADRTHFLDDMNPKLYVESPPQWNNNVRNMLAFTLGKPASPDDDKLCTTNEEYGSDYLFAKNSDNNSMDIQFNNKDSNFKGGFTSALQVLHSRNKRESDVKDKSNTKRYKL